MSETPETNMATSHKDPRSVAPLLATIADFARLKEYCNAQDASVVAMSEKVSRLERQRDELAAALRKLINWMPRVVPAVGQEDEWENEVNEACALLARLGEGGEG